jgi:hypothetical protein
MSLRRYSFTVESSPVGYAATLGDYDLDAPVGFGATEHEAIIDLLEMWGETLWQGGAA